MGWTRLSAAASLVSELDAVKEGCMFDSDPTLAVLAIALVVLTLASIVLSRIIPDEYDHRAPVRVRIDGRRDRSRR